MDAFYTFLADDGWAIASHIALSTLMALFPFLIVLTSLAGFFGSKELADQAAGLLLQVWPKQVADTLSSQIHDVMTTTRGGQVCNSSVAAWSANSCEPKKPASEVSTIRNGNNAISVDSAIWLAIAQPSSARKV